MIILNKILWGITTILIIYSGIYFTKKLNYVQFNIKKLFSSFSREKDGISSFATLTLSLGSRIGVGSLAGVALSIYYGGIGSIFWMCIITILTAPNSLVESTLAVIYREKDVDIYKGGPSFYINKGLNRKHLANIYAILIIIAYVGGFLSIQTNTMTLYIHDLTNINKTIIGLVISLISLIIFLRGTKYITKFTSYLVPVMSIFYIVISIIVIVNNLEQIPSIIYSIVKEAFNIKSFNYGLVTSIIIGAQRGIFATECGIGTGAIASGTSSTKSPIKQGMIQLIGVYFSTFVICMSTALIILTSPYTKTIKDKINGIEMTNFAFNYHLGSFGYVTLILLIFFFAFSTIISGYYYGESNLKYLLKKTSNKVLLMFQFMTFIILVLGSIIKSSILWNTIDILVAILSIINVSSCFLLRQKVFNEWNNYRKVLKDDRKRLGFNFKRRI
jgi:AGCS family alanine or glycine:cation symporter